MHCSAMKALAVAAVFGCVAARAEKVIFRDELTGCEIWRLTDYSAFHEYAHAAKPFAYDGRRMVCRQWWAEGGVVVIDLADGSETVCGRTTARIGGLAQATKYTLKVVALNEDGMAGPAATLQAVTEPSLP